jgi:hypothetical protein
MAEGARHELADHIATILKRAYPNEVAKDELEDQAGVSSKDLRAALDSLSEEGELDPLAEHFRWRDPSGQDKPPPDQPDEEDRQSATAPANTTAGGATGKLDLKVAIGFAIDNPEDDEGVKQQAQQIIEQIKSALEDMPGMGVAVSAKRLEVFDRPRVLFDAAEEASVEEAEPEAPEEEQ